MPPQHAHAHPSSAGQPCNVPEPRETLFSSPSFHSPLLLLLLRRRLLLALGRRHLLGSHEQLLHLRHVYKWSCSAHTSPYVADVTPLISAPIDYLSTTLLHPFYGAAHCRSPSFAPYLPARRSRRWKTRLTRPPKEKHHFGGTRGMARRARIVMTATSASSSHYPSYGSHLPPGLPCPLSLFLLHPFYSASLLSIPI